MLNYDKLKKEVKELINNIDMEEFDKWLKEKNSTESMTVQKLLDTIDLSKMETKRVSFDKMCESEFEIYEYLQQPEGKERLTYCYYYRWICTDTEVGIRVWYLDNQPVCISWKPFRKSLEHFAWLSKEDFHRVRSYALSLRDEDLLDNNIYTVDDEIIVDIFKRLSSIEYKKFEEFNIIKPLKD